MTTNAELAAGLRLAAKLLEHAAEDAANGELGAASEGWLDALDMLQTLDADSR